MSSSPHTQPSSPGVQSGPVLLPSTTAVLLPEVMLPEPAGPVLVSTFVGSGLVEPELLPVPSVSVSTPGRSSGHATNVKQANKGVFKCRIEGMVTKGTNDNVGRQSYGKVVMAPPGCSPALPLRCASTNDRRIPFGPKAAWTAGQ